MLRPRELQKSTIGDPTPLAKHAGFPRKMWAKRGERMLPKKDEEKTKLQRGGD